MIDEKELIRKLEKIQVNFEDYKIKNRYNFREVTLAKLFIYFIEKKLIKIVESMPKAGEWIPFKLDEDGHFKNIPYDGQIVLVSDGTSVWHDTFVNKGDGKFYFTFTYIDLDKLAWMPLPEPYKKEV